MQRLELSQPDYGTARKKLGIYLIGLLICTILTLMAFEIAQHPHFSRGLNLLFIYMAAFAQFLVQVICFLRLTTETEQGVNNILSFIFTIVILITIIAGSWWIMWSLNYYMIG